MSYPDQNQNQESQNRPLAQGRLEVCLWPGKNGGPPNFSLRWTDGPAGKDAPVFTHATCYSMVEVEQIASVIAKAVARRVASQHPDGVKT